MVYLKVYVSKCSLQLSDVFEAINSKLMTFTVIVHVILLMYTRKYTCRVSKRRRVLFAVVWREPGAYII